MAEIGAVETAAVGAVAVLAGPLPDHESLISMLAERIGRCPRLSQRPQRRVLDIGATEWVDADGFDPAPHVHRIGVPPPGSDRELSALVAEVMSWPLGRGRPLWELWIIDHLSDNRWAMVLKLHHRIADGAAAVQILTELSDDETRPGPGVDGRATEPPAGDGAAWPKMNPGSWPGLAREAVQAVRGATAFAAGILRPTPSLPNEPLTGLRRYSAAQVPLDDIRQVCQVYDVSADDVALAALAESYRAMFLRRGQQPPADSLRTLLASANRDDEHGAPGDGLSTTLPCLPVDEDNPIRRLQTVSARISETHNTGQGQVGELVAAVADRVPFVLASPALRLLTRLSQRDVAALVTIIAGPRRPLRVMGRAVVAVLPVPPQTAQLRTGATFLSYGGNLAVGIMADDDAIPDVEELARGVEAATARLVTKSRRRRPPRDHRGLSVIDSAG